MAASAGPPGVRSGRLACWTMDRRDGWLAGGSPRPPGRSICNAMLQSTGPTVKQTAAKTRAAGMSSNPQSGFPIASVTSDQPPRNTGDHPQDWSAILGLCFFFFSLLLFLRSSPPFPFLFRSRSGHCAPHPYTDTLHTCERKYNCFYCAHRLTRASSALAQTHIHARPPDSQTRVAPAGRPLRLLFWPWSFESGYRPFPVRAVGGCSLLAGRGPSTAEGTSSHAALAVIIRTALLPAMRLLESEMAAYLDYDMYGMRPAPGGQASFSFSPERLEARRFRSAVLNQGSQQTDR